MIAFGDCTILAVIGNPFFRNENTTAPISGNENFPFHKLTLALIEKLVKQKDNTMHYLEHLKKDKKLATILTDKLYSVRFEENIPVQLMASIMSQQLNTKVAKVIFDRFIGLFGGLEPTPEQVLAMPPETLRSIGLSAAKAAYVHNVASFCIEHHITDKKLLSMSNDEIIHLLTQIKGVGQWTVEMLLMFSLGREDVFALDDLGIQQAMKKLYKLDPEDKKQFKARLLKISDKWSPFRTYACIHLWKWKDDEPK